MFIDGEGLPANQLLELAESVFKKTCGKTVEAANYGSFRRVHVLPVTFFSSPSGCPPHSRGGDTYHDTSLMLRLKSKKHKDKRPDSDLLLCFKTISFIINTTNQFNTKNHFIL